MRDTKIDTHRGTAVETDWQNGYIRQHKNRHVTINAECHSGVQCMCIAENAMYLWWACEKILEHGHEVKCINGALK